LYADDLVLFVCPNAWDLLLVRSKFNIFEGASDLGCNLAKCQLMPIRCNQEERQLALESFPCQLADFPVRYLGIPLSVSKLPKSSLQLVADKVAERLPVWKGRRIRAGVWPSSKSILSAKTIHMAIILKLPPWLLKLLNKIMKAFVWCGSDVVQGGKCMVAWCRVQWPLNIGGLGIMDLNFLVWPCACAGFG
jgi:hypothetical protein